MTFSQVLTTILGGFLLPFAILVLWGRLVERLGPFGGWLVAAIIIGPIWYLNHGMLEPLIVQQGAVFIDMGFATAIGFFVYGLTRGIDFPSHRRNLLAALLGGSLAGLILSFL